MGKEMKRIMIFFICQHEIREKRKEVIGIFHQDLSFFNPKRKIGWKNNNIEKKFSNFSLNLSIITKGLIIIYFPSIFLTKHVVESINLSYILFFRSFPSSSPLNQSHKVLIWYHKPFEIKYFHPKYFGGNLYINFFMGVYNYQLLMGPKIIKVARIN